MCADLLIRRIQSHLAAKPPYGCVRHVPILLADHNQLSSTQLLQRLGSYFDCTLPAGEQTATFQAQTTTLIERICKSLDQDQVLLLEITVTPDLYSAEDFLRWFLDAFWSPLVNALARTVREENRPGLKCIAILAVDTSRPTACPLAERYWEQPSFGDEQCHAIVPLPLTNWTEEEIGRWLRLDAGLTPLPKLPELQKLAKRIYQVSRGGVPTYAYRRLLDELMSLPV